MNLYPKIVLYHDVLSEAEISYIRNEGGDKVIYDQNVAHLKDHLMSITKISVKFWFLCKYNFPNFTFK